MKKASLRRFSMLPLLTLASLAVAIPYHGGPAKTLPNLDGTVYVPFAAVVLWRLAVRNLNHIIFIHSLGGVPPRPRPRYPEFRLVFQPGECTRNDGRERPLPNGGGSTLIDTDKTCLGCFRIPTLLGGQSPGVIHAFAEGRRGELSGSFGKWTDMSGIG